MTSAADVPRAVLFLRGYTLKRTIRKAGDEEQNAGEAEKQTQADLAAKAPADAKNGSSEAVSREDAATEAEGTVHGEPSVENDGEKKPANASPA